MKKESLPLDYYMSQVPDKPLLSPEREVELSRRCKKGDEEARLEFIESNLRLVVSIAYRYRNSPIPLEDLIQEGNIGLMRAVERFDPEKGWKFSTYATAWIRQAMSRSVETDRSAIRLPCGVIQSKRKLQKAKDVFFGLYEREPTDIELADCAGISIETVERLQKTPDILLSIDDVSMIQNGEKLSLLDALVDTDQTPEEVAFRSFEHEEWSQIFEQNLSGQQREVIGMRHGFRSGKTKSLQEIGDEVGLCRERIRQIEISANLKIKEAATKVLDAFI